MIGYDPQSKNAMRVWTDVKEISTLYTTINTDYKVGLTLMPGTGSCHSSDDCSFNTEGYPTAYQFEGSATPYRHMVSDTADTLNYATLTKILQLGAGVVASAGGIHGRVP